MFDFRRKVEIFGESKVGTKLQADFFHGVFLILLELIPRGAVGCVDASQLEVAHDGDGVKTAVGLALESLHETVKVDGEVVPAPFFPVGVGTLHEERLHFQLIVG